MTRVFQLLFASSMLIPVVGCETVDTSDIESRLDVLEQENLSLRNQISDLEGSLDTDLPGDLGDLRDDVAALRGRWLNEDRTLTVDPSGGGDHRTIQAAVDEAAGFRILPNVTLTISLTPTTHALDQTLSLNHPNLDRVRIEGVRPSNTSLALGPGVSTGILVERGHHLGGLAGLTIQGSAGSGADAGLLLQENASVSIEDVTIDGMAGAGLRGRPLSSITSRQGVLTLSNNETGLSLVGGASAYFASADETAGLVVVDSAGVGVSLQEMSVASAPFARLERNRTAVSISRGSYGVFDDAELDDNTKGIFANFQAGLDARRVVVRGGARGIAASWGGFAVIEDCSVSDNADAVRAGPWGGVYGVGCVSSSRDPLTDNSTYYMDL